MRATGAAPLAVLWPLISLGAMAAAFGWENRTPRDLSETSGAAPRRDASIILPPKPPNPDAGPPNARIIAIGASTGGTEALLKVLREVPGDLPPIAIVQHLPELYSQAFADRLNLGSALDVKLACSGARLKRGCVYVAPGDRHLIVRRNGAGYACEVVEGELVARHRPSVDVLFRSVAQAAGRQALGVVLTGMGDDGARGLMEMRRAGAQTFVQDEASSVVFGMPRAALVSGAADVAVPLNKVGHAIADWAGAGTPGRNPG